MAPAPRYSPKIVGVDLLDMDPINGVDFIKGDFRDPKIVEQIQERIGIQGLDLVISDMAPNITGVKHIDQPNSVYLVEIVLEAVAKILRPGGSLIVKCFEGSGINELRSRVQGQFKKSFNFKPNASNSRSREVYLLSLIHI